MKTGTKSLLFGVHNIIWHPITVYMAWIKLYKKAPSFRETICIFIHDWGYWGCEHMDDEKGQDHPLWAGRLLFKHHWPDYYCNLCFFHSRHLAKKCDTNPSKLCWADKLSICFEPAWFYLLRARLTGELKEYREESAVCGFCALEESNKTWFIKMQSFMRSQAMAQKSSDIYFKTETRT